MIKFYRTDDRKIHEEGGIVPGGWIDMVNPTVAEGELIAKRLQIDIQDLLAALDEEESSRVELEDTEETPVLQAFVNGRVKEFSTKKKMRFVYQILFRVAALYQNDLRVIDKKRTEIEERIDDDTEDVDLIDLHALESTLVYFATSLRANGVVLDRLTRYKRLEQYPDDTDLLDDVIVENRQAIEMTTIYRDIINGTRELMSSVLDNRLNNVMKILTIVTLVMGIPTLISGIYGMNVSSKWMPLADTPHGFSIICLLIVFICMIAMFLLKKKKMF